MEGYHTYLWGKSCLGTVVALRFMFALSVYVSFIFILVVHSSLVEV